MFLIVSTAFCAIMFRYPNICDDTTPGYGFAYLARIFLALVLSALFEPILISAAVCLRRRAGTALAVATYLWSSIVATAATVVPFALWLSGACPSVRQDSIAPYWPWVIAFLAGGTILLTTTVVAKVRRHRRGRTVEPTSRPKW